MWSSWWEYSREGTLSLTATEVLTTRPNVIIRVNLTLIMTFQSLSLTTLHGWWLTIKQQDQLFLPGSNLSRYFLFLFSSSMYQKSSAVFRWNVGKSNQWYRIWQQNSHSCCGHKIRGDLLWNYNSPCNTFLWTLEERIWCVIRITPSSWLNYLLSWPLCKKRWEYFVWPPKNL